MTHSNRFTLAVIVAALLVGGCASGGGTRAGSVLPVGKYQVGDYVMIFNRDGTYLGTTTRGEDWVKGKYTANGDKLTVVDTWEEDQLVQQMGGMSCVGIKGVYRWTLVGDVLTATVVEDPCEGRIRGNSGVPWTRVR